MKPIPPLAALAALAILALPAAAQQTAPMPSHPSHEAAPRHGEATLDQRINQLHSELHITPAQQPQWERFTQVMRHNAEAMRETLDQRAAQLTSLNAAQNMQSYAELAGQHADDMRRLATAFQSLYDTMPEQQQQNAGVVFRGKLAHHRGHHEANPKQG